jgi:hypothetical protein
MAMTPQEMDLLAMKIGQHIASALGSSGVGRSNTSTSNSGSTSPILGSLSESVNSLDAHIQDVGAKLEKNAQNQPLVRAIERFDRALNTRLNSSPVQALQAGANHQIGGVELANLSGLSKLAGIVGGATAAVGTLSSSFRTLQGNLNQISSYFDTESLDIQNAMRFINQYNQSIIALSSTYARMGVGIGEVERSMNRIRTATGLTYQETQQLMTSYANGFNFASIANGERLMMNLKRAVGSNNQEMQTMMQTLGGLTQKFPDLEKMITRLDAFDRQQLAMKSTTLLASGQISLQEARTLNQYAAGNRQGSSEDQNRLKQVDSQVMNFKKIQQMFEDLVKQIGQKIQPFIDLLANKLVPLVNRFSGIISTVLVGFDGLAIMATGLTAVIGGVITAWKTVSDVIIFMQDYKLALSETTLAETAAAKALMELTEAASMCAASQCGAGGGGIGGVGTKAVAATEAATVISTGFGAAANSFWKLGGSMGPGIVASVAGWGLEKSLGPEKYNDGLGKREGHNIASMLKTGGEYATIGGRLFGPAGAAIGGAIGTLKGGFDELSKQVQLTIDAFTKMAEDAKKEQAQHLQNEQSARDAQASYGNDEKAAREQANKEFKAGHGEQAAKFNAVASLDRRLGENSGKIATNQEDQAQIAMYRSAYDKSVAEQNKGRHGRPIIGSEEDFRTRYLPTVNPRFNSIHQQQVDTDAKTLSETQKKLENERSQYGGLNLMATKADQASKKSDDSALAIQYQQITNNLATPGKVTENLNKANEAVASAGLNANIKGNLDMSGAESEYALSPEEKSQVFNKKGRGRATLEARSIVESHIDSAEQQKSALQADIDKNPQNQGLKDQMVILDGVIAKYQEFNSKQNEAVSSQESQLSAEREALNTIVATKQKEIDATKQLLGSQQAYVQAIVDQAQVTGQVDQGKVTGAVKDALATQQRMVALQQQMLSTTIEQSAAEKNLAMMRAAALKAQIDSGKLSPEDKAQKQLDLAQQNSSISTSNLAVQSAQAQMATDITNANKDNLEKVKQIYNVHQIEIDLAKEEFNLRKAQTQLQDTAGAGLTQGYANRQKAGESLRGQLAAEQTRLAAIGEARKVDGANQAALDIDEKKSRTEILSTEEQLVEMAKSYAAVNQMNIDLSKGEADLMKTRVQMADSFGFGVAASAGMRLQYNDKLKQQLVEQEEQYKAIILRQQQAQGQLAGAKTPEDQQVALAQINSLTLERQKSEQGILQIQMEQQENLKSLRDNYLSAIASVNTGTGVITKVMTDQNKNLGSFLGNVHGAVQSLSTGGVSKNGVAAGYEGASKIENQVGDSGNIAIRGPGRRRIGQSAADFAVDDPFVINAGEENGTAGAASGAYRQLRKAVQGGSFADVHAALAARNAAPVDLSSVSLGGNPGGSSPTTAAQNQGTAGKLVGPYTTPNGLPAPIGGVSPNGIGSPPPGQGDSIGLLGSINKGIQTLIDCICSKLGVALTHAEKTADAVSQQVSTAATQTTATAAQAAVAAPVPVPSLSVAEQLQQAQQADRQARRTNAPQDTASGHNYSNIGVSVESNLVTLDNSGHGPTSEGHGSILPTGPHGRLAGLRGGSPQHHATSPNHFGYGANATQRHLADSQHRRETGEKLAFVHTPPSSQYNALVHTPTHKYTEVASPDKHLTQAQLDASSQDRKRLAQERLDKAGQDKQRKALADRQAVARQALNDKLAVERNERAAPYVQMNIQNLDNLHDLHERQKLMLHPAVKEQDAIVSPHQQEAIVPPHHVVAAAAAAKASQSKAYSPYLSPPTSAATYSPFLSEADAKAAAKSATLPRSISAPTSAALPPFISAPSAKGDSTSGKDMSGVGITNNINVAVNMNDVKTLGDLLGRSIIDELKKHNSEMIADMMKNIVKGLRNTVAGQLLGGQTNG